MIFLGCNLSCINPLKCVLMNNRKCKVRPEIVNVNSNSLYFILLTLKQVNAAVVVTILMIPMQNCVYSI